MLEFINNLDWYLVALVVVYLICVPLVLFNFVDLLALDDKSETATFGDHLMAIVCVLSAPLALLCFYFVAFAFYFPKSKYGKKYIAWKIERKLRRKKIISPLDWAVTKRRIIRKEKRDETDNQV